MEKRIELEKRRLSPSQVTELTLDNCRSTSIEGLTDEFVNLKTLSMVGVGLTSLKGLPKLPKLEKLDLSENRISGGLQILKELESLSTLNLSENNIADMETLEPLKEIKPLKSLDLFGNSLSSLDDYREQIFSFLPELKYLDGLDRNGKDSESDEEKDNVKFNGVSGKKGYAYKNRGQDDDDDLGEEEEGDDDLDALGVGEDGDVTSEDDSEGVSEEEETDEETKEIGLKDIYRNDLDQESDSDYENDNVASSDDEDNISDDEEAPVPAVASPEGEPRRGTKRPHDEDESA